MYQQAEFTDRLKLISADNARCHADIAALKKQRKFEVSEYRRKGLAFLDLQEELNNLIDAGIENGSPNHLRIQELTDILQNLPPLKRPAIEEMDALLILNRMKLKENMRATRIELCRNISSNK